MSVQRYAVIGHPVAHSLSPRIHAEFARQAGIALEYTAIDVAPDAFDAVLAEFAAEGGAGANVTLPHKTRAAQICNYLSEAAKRAGAVNTLIRTATGWQGDNTDGIGLVRDLTERHGLDLRARRTLLIGAGGAARGIAPALLDAGIGDLYIVNRTAERADALADVLAQPGRVHARYLDDVGNLGNFDLVINATSATRGASLPALPINLVAPRGAAVDLSYGEAAVAFLAWARSAHAHDCIDGLGMLVEQAAESFQRWHSVRPETDAVYAMLRDRSSILVTAD